MTKLHASAAAINLCVRFSGYISKRAGHKQDKITEISKLIKRRAGQIRLLFLWI